VGDGVGEVSGVGLAVGVGVGVGGVGVGVEVAFGEVVGWGDCEGVGVGVREGCIVGETDGVGVGVAIIELEVVGCFNMDIAKMPTAVITMSKIAMMATLEFER
jgi:hypothetical protein